MKCRDNVSYLAFIWSLTLGKLSIMIVFSIPVFYEDIKSLILSWSCLVLALVVATMEIGELCCSNNEDTK